MRVVWRAPSPAIARRHGRRSAARRGRRSPYVYPGTDVLKNKPGLRDKTALKNFEYDHVAQRTVELRGQPLPARFDLKHLQRIHKHLFQDVYEFAGEIRTVEMTKSGPPFASPAYIESEGRRLSAELARENNFRGLGQPEFARRLAHHFSDWNALHAQREGNGRAIREFVGQIAQGAGYYLDQTRIDNSKNTWNEASRLSLSGRMEEIEAIFAHAVRPARSVAFEQLPEDQAVAKHPELKSQFEILRNVERGLAARFSDDSLSRETYAAAARIHIVGRLDEGKLLTEQEAPERAPPRHELASSGSSEMQR